SDLVSLLHQRETALADKGHALARVPWLTLIAALVLPALGDTAASTDEQRSDLAGVLVSRGIAKADGGDLAGAIADYDAAIGLLEAIRDALGAAWPVPLQNDLAASLGNRGTAKCHSADLAARLPITTLRSGCGRRSA